jgi:hypothetical protein
MSSRDWEADELDDDGDDELAAYCDRCAGAIAVDTGGLVTVDCGPGDVVDWVLCDDCVDSFTAWRLARDPAPAGDGDAPWPAGDGGSDCE